MSGKKQIFQFFVILLFVVFELSNVAGECLLSIWSEYARYVQYTFCVLHLIKKKKKTEFDSNLLSTKWLFYCPKQQWLFILTFVHKTNRKTDKIERTQKKKTKKMNTTATNCLCLWIYIKQCNGNCWWHVQTAKTGRMNNKNHEKTKKGYILKLGQSPKCSHL